MQEQHPSHERPAAPAASRTTSRRAMLRGAAIGGAAAAALAIRGGSAFADAAGAAPVPGAPDAIGTILDTLLTMEYLATTYLTNAIANAVPLGLTTSAVAIGLGTPATGLALAPLNPAGVAGAVAAVGPTFGPINPGQITTVQASGSLGTASIQQRTGFTPPATFLLQPLGMIRAALVEEQDHVTVLQLLGATPTTTTFSLPNGPATFTDFASFVDTLIILETTCIASYLTALLEVATLGRPDLAMLMGRLVGVESEHRVGARTMAGLAPPNNVSFEDTPFASMAEVVAAVTALGFLSPSGANAFPFPGLVPVDPTGVIQRFP